MNISKQIKFIRILFFYYFITLSSNGSAYENARIKIDNDPINIKEKLLDFEQIMFVEIPAGDIEKWEFNIEASTLDWEQKKDGTYRVINFLPYPGNYGFIAGTMAKDGDPLDVLCICKSQSKGTLKKVRIVGVLKFKDKGLDDHKIIAVDQNELFGSEVFDIHDITYNYPNALTILQLWFQGYKKLGKMVFLGYGDREEALRIIMDNSIKSN